LKKKTGEESEVDDRMDTDRPLVTSESQRDAPIIEHEGG
jgi:hypothetical protein